MLHGLTRLAMSAPRRVLATAILVIIGCAVFGVPVAKHLSGGGFRDPTSESARASAILADTFDRPDMQFLLLVSSERGVHDPQVQAVGTDIVGQLKTTPDVAFVESPWSSPPNAAAELISKDGRSALIVAGLTGTESQTANQAAILSDRLTYNRDGVSVEAGGPSTVNAQINKQSERDLVRMESIALPLSFVVLVAVFGGLVAATLPLVVGAMAIFGTMAVLRLMTFVTDVSIFALNLATAMGLALAIDYTLLILSRYRHELAEGHPRDQALMRTMTSAGRTVLFSAVIVGLSMLPMALFPMYFLKSFAYAGVSVVAFAAGAALVVTPAVITLLGARLDALDVRRLLRRALRRPEPVPPPVERTFWYRTTKAVTRRAVPLGLAVVVFLLLLGTPFLGVRWGFPDEQVLPTSASAHRVGDELRMDFAANSATAVTIVLPDIGEVAPQELDRYGTDLSTVPDVPSVSGPGGTYVAGQRIGPPSAPAGLTDGKVYFTVASTTAVASDASESQLDRLHEVPPPGGVQVEMTGIAQSNHDIVHAVTGGLPLVLGLIAVTTFVMLFLLTGSVVLPLKALVLNVLSLTAAFGGLVWIFQDGHFAGLGTTVTGTLAVTMPLLLFCIAFGLSMDYEVFLLARIREYWLASAQSRADNDEAVALGLAHTGRVVTAAAVIMSISFAALIAAQVSFMRMFGVGLTLAVLMDATLVRMILLPAFMHVMGRANWWAPAPLVRLHTRIGISESPPSGRHARLESEVVDRASRADVGEEPVIEAPVDVISPGR
ncbi:MAG: MMPL family transporter [Mycobacteriaceae bacterium]